MNTNIIKNILEKAGHHMFIDENNMETANYYKPLRTCYNDEDKKNTKYVLDKRILHVLKFLCEIGANLEYVKSGTTGHTFKGTIMKDGKEIYSFALKMSAYRKHNEYGDVNNIARPENAEIMMLRLLSYFIETGQTQHLILPIQTFNTNIKYFLHLDEMGYIHHNRKGYQDFVENYKKGEYYNEVSILMSEWANKGDFLSFVRNRYENMTLKHWRCLIFQILSVLSVIQSKYPAFRHNDMKANNILVQKNEDIQMKKICINRYILSGKEYVVPNIGYIIKLWDFDFACIPGVVNNIKVTEEWTRSINVTPKRNQYYDIHYFFNTLIKSEFFPEIMDENKVDGEIRKFIDRILPLQYRSCPYVHKKGRLLVDIEYTTPRKILETDPLFECYRNNGNNGNNN
jgi:serine/threonine protein kinase